MNSFCVCATKRSILVLSLLLLALPAVAGVNVASGGLSHRQPLFAAQGGPLPLTIDLSYDSLDPLSGVMGRGWSHSYDIYLHANSDGTMVLTGGVGKRFYFVAGSGFKASIVDASTLEKKTDNSWTVTRRDGLKYNFSTDKRLSSIVDRHGNRVRIENTGATQTTVTDPSGRSAIFHYNTNGKIDWIKDPAQQQYDFTYNIVSLIPPYNIGQLNGVQYPEPVAGAGRPTWSYLYTAANELAYITDPGMHISKYVYSGGKVVRSVDPEGMVNTTENEDETADSAEHSKTLAYGFARGVPEANATTVTEKDGGQWVYRYYAEGQLRSKEDPEFKYIDYNYHTSGSYNGRLRETITPIDDNTVHVVRIETYDDYGNPSVVKSLSRPAAGGVEVFDQNLEYTYDNDSYDRVTNVSDLIAGTVTGIAYDTVYDVDGYVASEKITMTAPKINAGDSSAPQTTIDYTRSRIDQITDPLGRHFNFGYGETGLLQTITDAASNIVATFSDFDAFGRAETVTVSKLVQPDPPVADRVVALDYDFLGRLTGITQSNVVLTAGSPAERLTTVFGYDLLGNRISVLDPEQSALPVAEQKPTTFNYNARGQVDKITDALNQVTELLYSGAGCASCGGGVDKLVGVKDAKLQQTDFTYDQSGRLVSESDPLDGTIPPGKTTQLSTTLLYRWTDNGLLKERWHDVNGNDTIDDAIDRKLLSFTWRPNGKLASKTDHVTNETTTFTYYPLPAAPATDPRAGRLWTVIIPNRPTASYTFDYFANGWLKSVSDGSGRNVEYLYDAAGQRELVTIKQGATMLRTLDYIYDGQKRLEKIRTEVDPSHTGDEEFIFGYDAWGRRGTLTYPNGVVAWYNYNNQTDWLEGIDYKNGVAGPLLLDIAYPEHDKVGNRKQRVEDNVATDYVYDATYQLRSATTGPSVEAFDYDAVGNRKSGPTVKDTEAAAYDHDAGNRMLEGRQFDYSYDEFGNQQFRYLDAVTPHRKFWQYSWDGENRLIEARLEKDGATLRTVSFKYDPFGRRVEKRVEGLAPQVPVPLTTTYLYDGADIVLESVADGSTTVTTQYIHGPGIDEPLAMVRNGQSYFYHADGLGSIVAITDSTPAVVQHYAYDAFGMVTPSQPDFANPYTYTGREWDPETGLYFYRARYYDPMEGRFISKDPIGFAGGDVNLYGYVGNSPVNFIDPFGLTQSCYRPLRYFPIMVVGNSNDRRINTVIGHEHIFFDDGSDVGYGGDGIYSGEDKSEYSQCQDIAADKDQINKIIDKMKNDFSADDYRLRSRAFGGNNCQDFVDAIRGAL